MHIPEKSHHSSLQTFHTHANVLSENTDLLYFHRHRSFHLTPLRKYLDALSLHFPSHFEAQDIPLQAWYFSLSSHTSEDKHDCVFHPFLPYLPHQSLASEQAALFLHRYQNLSVWMRVPPFASPAAQAVLSFSRHLSSHILIHKYPQYIFHISVQEPCPHTFPDWLLLCRLFYPDLAYVLLYFLPPLYSLPDCLNLGKVSHLVPVLLPVSHYSVLLFSVLPALLPQHHSLLPSSRLPLPFFLFPVRYKFLLIYRKIFVPSDQSWLTPDRVPPLFHTPYLPDICLPSLSSSEMSFPAYLSSRNRHLSSLQRSELHWFPLPQQSENFCASSSPAVLPPVFSLVLSPENSLSPLPQSLSADFLLPFSLQIFLPASIPAESEPILPRTFRKILHDLHFLLHIFYSTYLFSFLYLTVNFRW